MYFIMGCFAFLKINAQHMQVSGKNVKDSNGNIVTLRGIDFPIMDVGNVNLNNAATYQGLIDEFAKTGANVIRIPWSTNGYHWRDKPQYGGTAGTMDGYVANGKLAALIDYCFSKNLFVILDIHNDDDQYNPGPGTTCDNDWATFNSTVMGFWKSANIVNLINTHQSRLIINLANEFGYDTNWGGSMSTFQTNYINAIASLRGLGITVPILIDSPDCGQASSSLVSVSAAIFNSDSLGNTMFSAHAYWSGYADTNTQIDTKMNEMINSSQCFILGEVANLQDNASCGDTDITSIYQRVLSDACPAKMGWLAWSYYMDCAVNRQVTTTGNFANLTTFGNDIVNNVLYGLKTSTCAAALQVSEPESDADIQVFPNPNHGEFTIQTKSNIIGIELMDQSSRKISNIKKLSKNTFSVKVPNGVYTLDIKTESGNFSKKLIIGK
jgi:mannan endo-1,4-beta-mannosidase